MKDIHDLKRFENAQETNYDIALNEIKNGKKKGHWMWYVFPQIDGLGFSMISKKYAINSKEEAIAYLNHNVLGMRLIKITKELLLLNDTSATNILGHTDALKLKSCMTLFDLISTNNDLFLHVLQKYFEGNTCKLTKEKIN